MKIGSVDVSSVKIGSTDVSKIYIGSTEVWSSFTGLLDTYTGAAAAYSLRQLSSSYSGDAIRVRRASDNTESDIGFVSNELDVASLESFCNGTNGYVTTWYDQSGNSYDATQNTASDQPQIVSSGSTITENGKPAIRFINSSTTSLQANYSFNYVTTFTLTRFFTRPAFAYIYSAYGASRNLMGDRQPEGYRIYASNNLFLGQTPSLTNQDLIYALFNSSNSQIALDGGSIVSGDAGTFSSSGLTLGSAGSPNADAYLNGTMQEAIFYPSDQSSNRSDIESNINAQYNIYWDGSQTSLLDSYGGSAAAYSLRALSSSYTGALIKVRRASDNAEQDIFAKHDGTLNTDALESFCSGTNGFVTTWYDQSGNGYNATQTTASNQPQIVSSGSTILENGKPAIQSASTTGLQTTSNIDFSSSSDINVFSIHNVDNINQDNLILQHSNISTIRGAFFLNRSSIGKLNSVQNIVSTSNRLIIQSVNNPIYNSQVLINMMISQPQVDTNYLTTYENGVNLVNEVYTTFSGTSVSFVNDTLSLYSRSGNTVGFRGKYQELILYPSDQSSNRTGIETNINNFYNIY